jgi:hypothetical protein
MFHILKRLFCSQKKFMAFLFYVFIKGKKVFYFSKQVKRVDKSQA